MPTVTFTWIKDNDLTRYHPICQVTGICFTSSDEILIIKNPSSEEWKLPGGKMEAGETFEETLIRELEEEATVRVKNCRALGVQKVNYPNNPNLVEGEEFYQARYVCEIDELLPNTVDPDNGLLHDRKLVSMSEIEKWVQWGDVGHEMFEDAIEMWRKE